MLKHCLFAFLLPRHRYFCSPHNCCGAINSVLMNKQQIFAARSFCFTILLVCLVPGLMAYKNTSTLSGTQKSIVYPPANEALHVYESLSLNELGLSREAFLYALKGYRQLQEKGELLNDAVLSVIDFSLPSTQKRFFVIDLNSNRLLHHTYVSHGKHSGKLMARHFSNRSSSYQSSLGFYVTGNTYFGKHGFSLRLIGKEKGINDKALQRGIVIHSADYASEQFSKQQGYLGRSQGCPAVPETVHQQLITSIQNGSCLFIYSPSRLYLKQSGMI